MKVAIIIVTYNSKSFIINCLHSLWENVLNKEHRVVVVDNASTDGTINIIAKYNKDIMVISNSRNVGYATAVNQAIRAIESEYYLLLNPDTVILNHAVQKMVAFMDEHPKAGILGPQFIDEKGVNKPSCFIRYPNILTEIMISSGIGKIINNIAPNSNYPGRYTLCNNIIKKGHKVAHLLGAGILIRGNALKSVGLFNESFFFLREETELCYRMRQKGWEVWHEPSSVIVHYGGGSVNPLGYQAKVLNTNADRIYFCECNRRLYGIIYILNRLSIELIKALPWLFVFAIPFFKLHKKAYNKIRNHLEWQKALLNTAVDRGWKHVRPVKLNCEINRNIRVGLDVSIVERNNNGLARSVNGLMNSLASHSGKDTLIVNMKRNKSWNIGKTFLGMSMNAVRLLYYYNIQLPISGFKNRIHLLHVPIPISPIFCSVPRIVTINDVNFLKFPRTYPKRWRWFFRVTSLHAVCTARRVITCSDSAKDEAIQYLHANPEILKTIHWGLNNTIDSDVDGNIEKCILFVGRIEPIKNLSMLIEAYHILMGLMNQSCSPLMIVGDEGQDSTNIRKMIIERNLYSKVKLLGHVDDKSLARLYQSSLIYVVPSLNEGFGFPPLEAMQYGVPVVASDIPALKEVLGDAALFFNPRDPNDIANKLYSAINDSELRKLLSAKGRDNVRKYSWKHCAEEYINVYRETIPLINN